MSRSARRTGETFISSRGTVLEIIRADMEVPKGLFIFEDPPLHDLHRRLMGRVFTPRRVALLEDRMRQFCAAALDPFVGEPGFDFVRDLGADLPMRGDQRDPGHPGAGRARGCS